MNSRSKASNTFFVLTFALTFYCLGASFVEGFVNYRTWSLIGPDEFKTYHQALSPLIVRTLVMPLALQSVMSIILLWFRPRVIPRWAIITAIVFGLINWASSIFIQIPIQMQLYSGGYSLELIDKLILTDWIRKISLIAEALLFLWLMGLVLSKTASRNLDISLPAEEK